MFKRATENRTRCAAIALPTKEEHATSELNVIG